MKKYANKWMRDIRALKAIGTVEVILILVVLIALVLLFKNQILSIAQNIFTQISKSVKQVY